MMDFALWFLQELPDFLLAPPISAFTGLIVLSWVITLFWRMINIHR